MKFVPLCIKADDVALGEYDSQTMDDVVSVAVVRKYRIDNGYILVTIWNDLVHEVIYQTPLPFFWSRWNRNRTLLNFYGDGRKWAEDWPVDFGKSRKTDDGTVRCLYGKMMDYISFMTVEFDAHRKELRWGNLNN